MNEENQRRRTRRRERPVKKKKGRILAICLAALVLAGAVYGVHTWADYSGSFQSSAEVTVKIPSGSSGRQIAAQLAEDGIISHKTVFYYYMRMTGAGAGLKPGSYVLRSDMSYAEIVEALSAGSEREDVARVTVPEGLSLREIADLLEEKGVCPADEFLDYLDTADLGQYDFVAELPDDDRYHRLEGYIFPDTYDFYVNDDPDRVLEKLLSNFNRKFSDDASAQLETLNTALAERWTAKGYDESYIEAHRMTIYDLVTVASMIEKETASAKESSTIASVIYNRLCDPANYPYLNVDATIVYALGGVDGALTYEDTQIDSPYNTYNRTGLPAGPISNPGLSSISAALNPADTSYYYYALDDSTGLHHFSESYDEHQAFLAGQNDA